MLSVRVKPDDGISQYRFRKFSVRRFFDGRTANHYFGTIQNGEENLNFISINNTYANCKKIIYNSADPRFWCVIHMMCMRVYISAGFFFILQTLNEIKNKVAEWTEITSR